MDETVRALTEAVSENPSDTLSISALADYLEERGADVSKLRVLTIDGPTVLVFGVPNHFPIERKRATNDMAVQIQEFFERESGHKVMFAVCPAELTIRQIKSERKVEQ